MKHHQMCTHYLKIIFCLFPFLVFAQNIDPVALEDTISKLNDHHEYETSLLKLDEIINNPESSASDRSHAYIQKSYTFKRVYNYVMAINNLNLAKEEALKSRYKDKLLAKILAEKLFVYFDMQEEERVVLYLDSIGTQEINYLERETLAHYYSVVAAVAIWEEDFKKAEEYYDLAISILEKENPKHLPNVFRAKTVLYAKLGNKDKALESFERGLHYAQKHDVEIYEIIMYEGLLEHYKIIGDKENAAATKKTVKEKRAKYDASNSSNKLFDLDKNLKEEKRRLELKKEEQRKNYLIITSIVVLVLLIALSLYLRSTIKNAKVIKRENEYIRKQIEKLSAEIGENNSKLNLNEQNLTERQLEVIKLVKEGKTNKEIGSELYISENTVKYHLKAIYDLLGVENRTALKQNYEA